MNAFTCFCWLPAAADFFLAVERCHFVPVGIYMFKVNSRNSTARCEIYSNLTTNTSELRQCSNWWLYRSSHCRSSVKKVVLKNFANFTGNQLCWILFLIKLFEIFTSTYLEEYLRTTASDLNFFTHCCLYETIRCKYSPLNKIYVQSQQKDTRCLIINFGWIWDIVFSKITLKL